MHEIYAHELWFRRRERDLQRMAEERRLIDAALDASPAHTRDDRPAHQARSLVMRFRRRLRTIGGPDRSPAAEPWQLS